MCIRDRDVVSELLKDKDIENNEQGRRLLEQYGYWGNKGNAFYMQFRHQVMVTGAVSTVICVLLLTFLLYWKKKEDACHKKIVDLSLIHICSLSGLSFLLR